MATIYPKNRYPSDVQSCLWEAITVNDDTGHVILSDAKGAIGSVQMTGTFGGATVSLEVSNDKANWVILKDIQGADIAMASPGLVDFSTAALYLRVSTAGGSGQNVNVTAVLHS